MFRRAKLMLNRIDASVVGSALDAERLLARVDLTGDDGGPRCARVDPPAIEWSVPASDQAVADSVGTALEQET